MIYLRKGNKEWRFGNFFAIMQIVIFLRLWKMFWFDINMFNADLRLDDDKNLDI